MATPITIFYTDDDREDLFNFQEAVNDIQADITLLTMDHGDELLNALHTPPPSPNIIFLDLNMPGKSGFELLKEIKTSERFAGYPVVIFSTSDDPKTISATRDLGADLYITKPTSFPALKKAIQYSINIDWELIRPQHYIYTAN
jgi:DNA-binding response OmpR family regulator